MFIAVEEGKDEDVVALIVGGVDVNEKDGNESTALIKASSGGHDGVVGRLLAAGADVSARNDMNHKANHSEAVRRSVEALKLLDVDAGGAQGKRPLHY